MLKVVNISQFFLNLFSLIVWFEPTNWIKVSKLFEALGPNALNRLEIISPNMQELEALAAQLNDEGESEKFVRQLKG